MSPASYAWHPRFLEDNSQIFSDIYCDLGPEKMEEAFFSEINVEGIVVGIIYRLTRLLPSGAATHCETRKTGKWC